MVASMVDFHCFCPLICLMDSKDFEWAREFCGYWWQGSLLTPFLVWKTKLCLSLPNAGHKKILIFSKRFLQSGHAICLAWSAREGVAEGGSFGGSCWCLNGKTADRVDDGRVLCAILFSTRTMTSLTGVWRTLLVPGTTRWMSESDIPLRRISHMTWSV